MPSANSKRVKSTRAIPPNDAESQTVAESLPVTERPRSKTRGNHVVPTQDYDTDILLDTEIAIEEEPPTDRNRSILGQTASAFGRRHDTPDLLQPVVSQEGPPDRHLRTQEWSQQTSYGKSPPTDIRGGFQVAESQAASSPPTRGGFYTKSPPISPRPRTSRPVSFGGVNAQPPPRGQPSDNYRRPPSLYGSPPAPHLPQAHFYNAQDVDLGIRPRNPVEHGEDITFASVSRSSQNEKSHTILLGSEGRLDVLLADRLKTTHVGSICELGGTVVEAIPLSWAYTLDGNDHSPLVAVVSHGQLLSQDEDYATEHWDGPAQSIKAMSLQANVQPHTQYQTRVEVYSLSTRKRLSTFLSMPPSSAEPAYGGKFYVAPRPSGNIKLASVGKFLTVAIGTSGEVFIFGMTPDQTFECLGKVWTAIQPQTHRRDSSHGRSPDADVSPADLNRNSYSESPILSLSHRWMAFSPPPQPSRASVSATLGGEVDQNRAFGLSQSYAPTRPSTLCDVDSPDVDTLFGKVVRGVTQHAIKGAGWVFDQGKQAFNNYWRRDQASEKQFSSAMSPQTLSPLPPPQHFPPTHAFDAQSPTTEPDLVSVIDLSLLGRVSISRSQDFPASMVTFQPPGGCSYLSFTPNGLSILTASRKGDLHYVWDLLQAKYHRLAPAVVGAESGELLSTAPRVRQLAKFPRYTTSTIVDIVWTPVTGERFAVVTKNGSIHLYDIPSSAFRWPPPRRIRRARPMSMPVEPLPESSSTRTGADATGGFFASAINFAGRTPPMIATLRGRAPSFGAAVSNLGSSGIGFASATGAQGSRALMSGFSKSLGAASGGVQQMKLAGESRIHLKSLANDPSSRRIVWMPWKSPSALLVLDKTAVRMYTVSRTPATKAGGTKMSIFDTKKPVGHKLPTMANLLRTSVELSDEVAIVHPDSPGHELFPGFWLTSSKPTHAPTDVLPHPLSHAEIESNAPYQPFHSDSRVSIGVYGSPTLTESQYPTVSTFLQPQRESSLARESSANLSALMIFGQEMPVRSLRASHEPQLNEDHLLGKSVVYRETSVVAAKIEAGDQTAEQIVTTTRRRKARKDGGLEAAGENALEADDEGFFEDDCDVLDFADDRV